MDWSQSKLIRIETGAVNISTNDLRALLAHYDIDPARINTLVDLARAAREVPRWNIYKDVASPEYISFLGYESSASVIRNFEPLLVPGLLQTEEYARSVISVIEPGHPQRIDALVDLRMQRQEIITRDPAPELHFIMDEAVIRRVVGGLSVARRQLRHLLEMNQQDNVTMRVVSFSRGIYSKLRVPYVLFEFPESEDEDVLYLENPTGEFLIRENSPEERDQVDPVNYLGAFWQLEQIAPRDDFGELIEKVAASLERDSNSPLQTGGEDHAEPVLEGPPA